MAPYYEPGTYLAAIVGQGFQPSSEKKTPQFVLRIVPKLLFGSDGAEHPVPQEYERTIYRPITDGTLGRLLQDLSDLGWHGTQLAQLDPSTEGYHSFVGQEIKVACKHDDYRQTGNPQETWEIAGERRAIAPSSPDSLRRLDDAFGRAIKDFRKGNPAPAVTPAPTAPTPTPEAAERDIGVDGLAFAQIQGNLKAAAALRELAAEAKDDDIPF